MKASIAVMDPGEQSSKLPCQEGAHGPQIHTPYRHDPFSTHAGPPARSYCYDFPAVFENALREIWAGRAAAGEPGAVPPPGEPPSQPAGLLPRERSAAALQPPLLLFQLYFNIS